ncbi:helicase associated domain-containing protein [Streptomyces collinus]|uniref:helicase associated domain-containing protein n=1 Tax=Streptomyces collinus TaxID=42684 RepID=UPI0036CAF2B1
MQVHISVSSRPVRGESTWDIWRVLLRFGAHRDPALIARMVRYNLLEPEHANWKAGHQAAVAYRERTGHLAVPYGHRELMPAGHSFPLGRWLADQRRALAAGRMATQRAEELDALGIVWDPTDAAWEENLSAARAYYAETGTLAAPVTATALNKPVGQWLANCRKKHGLGKNQAVARRRAAQLAARGAPAAARWPAPAGGTIPADAGSTRRLCSPAGGCRNHPRGRGEHVRAAGTGRTCVLRGVRGLMDDLDGELPVLSVDGPGDYPAFSVVHVCLATAIVNSWRRRSERSRASSHLLRRSPPAS